MRHSPLLERLGIRHPIVQAPMASASTPALAAAVSNAGGLGSLGCAMLTPEAFRAELHATRAATDGPVNVNFFVHAAPSVDPAKVAATRALLQPFYDELGLGAVPGPGPVAPPFDEAMLAAVLVERPPVVSFHFGLPAPQMLDAIRDTGAAVLSSATTVHEARLLAAGGVDAVIAQGWEAGGHRGTFASPFEAAQVGTLALVPQIVDAVEVPVIAAGGIADGRGIAACLALGAAAAQIGTAFLPCPESAISEPHRRALAGAADADTRVTRAFSGRPARGLRNRYLEAIAGFQAELPDFPLVNALTGPLRAESARRGLPDFLALWSGQTAALGRVQPATALVERLLAETRAALSALG